MSRSRAVVIALLLVAMSLTTATARAQDDDPTLSPYAMTAPTLAGTPVIGQTLTVADATWSQPGVSVHRDWQRCPDGRPDCISTGQTGPSYPVTKADAGTTIIVVETGTNAAGLTSEPTGSTGEYVDAPTVDPVDPTPQPAHGPGPGRPKTSSRQPDGLGAGCVGLGFGEQCGPGYGRTTAGGGGKVSHKGWPAVSGVLWKVIGEGRGHHRRSGTPLNDELLGHHGDDSIDGGEGDDILWGDWDPSNNNTVQHDVLRGGPGNDFIYPSHGTNRVSGGAGSDHVIAFYGHGTIDCGPGRDTVQVRPNGAYELHGCETVKHF